MEKSGGAVRSREGMSGKMWYLLKTWTGGEEELVERIRRTVPPYMYQEAFAIHSERIWRRQGKSILHLELPFPGCVFLTCEKTQPLFRRFEQVPSMSSMMSAGSLSVFPLTGEDEEFLKRISGTDHIIRLSGVFREKAEGTEYGQELEDRAYRVSGPLRDCLENLEGIEFRKRFAKIKRRLWGEDLTIAMGIVLNGDREEGILYENLGIVPEESLESLGVDGSRTVMEVRKDPKGKKQYKERKAERKSETCAAAEECRPFLVYGSPGRDNGAGSGREKAVG